jgi:CAAX protease family protein
LGAAVLAPLLPTLNTDEGVVPMLSGHILLATVAATLSIALVVLGRTSWQELGWHGGMADARSLGGGLVLGVAMGGVTVLLVVGLGGAGLAFTGESLALYLKDAWVWGVALVVAGLSEELWFRGYPLARLAGAAGKVWASVVLSAGFAALHLLNPSVSPLGVLNIGLASLVLSAAFLSPGGLPFAWGLHTGWNAGLGLLADAPVSGIEMHMAGVEFSPGSRGWFTGGSFGPEGGIAATIVMGATLIWLARRVARAGEEAT